METCAFRSTIPPRIDKFRFNVVHFNYERQFVGYNFKEDRTRNGAIWTKRLDVNISTSWKVSSLANGWMCLTDR